MRISGVVSFLLLLTCSIGWADNVYLLSGSRVWQETDSGSDSSEIEYLPVQMTSVVSGASGVGQADYDLVPTDFDFALQHASQSSQFFGRSEGDLYFGVEDTTPYRLISSFSAAGSGAWTAFVHLRDLITGDTLFTDVRFSGSEPLPGVVPDDVPPEPSGSATGDLLKGRKYQLRYVLYSMADPGFSESPPDFGSVWGVVNALYGPDSVVVPLPPAVWAGAALMGMVVFRRKLSLWRRRGW